MTRDRISEWLEVAGITQKEFGAQIGVCQACVSKWATGQRVPRRAQMQKIVSASRGFIQPSHLILSSDAPYQTTASTP